MRGKAIFVLSSVCLLGAAAVLTGTTNSASSGTSRAAVPQPGWLAALQFKDLTLGAALP